TPTAPGREPAAASSSRPVPLRTGERQLGRPQRRERIVGDLAGPCQVPQRLLELLWSEVDVDQQVREEAGPGAQTLPHQPERIAQSIDAGPGCGMAIDALPHRREPRKRSLIRRLDLLAKDSERRPSHSAQHLRMTPLALAAAGTQLAPHELAAALELRQHSA